MSEERGDRMKKVGGKGQKRTPDTSKKISAVARKVLNQAKGSPAMMIGDLASRGNGTKGKRAKGREGNQKKNSA